MAPGTTAAAPPAAPSDTGAGSSTDPPARKYAQARHARAGKGGYWGSNEGRKQYFFDKVVFFWWEYQT